MDAVGLDTPGDRLQTRRRPLSGRDVLALPEANVKRRLQSETDRIEDSRAARDRREAERGIPEFTVEEITAQHSNDPITLRRLRSARPTEDRLERLEAKHDELMARYDRLVRDVIGSRTKIIVALLGLGAGVIGYLLGACA